MGIKRKIPLEAIERKLSSLLGGRGEKAANALIKKLGDLKNSLEKSVRINSLHNRPNPNINIQYHSSTEAVFDNLNILQDAFARSPSSNNVENFNDEEKIELLREFAKSFYEFISSERDISKSGVIRFSSKHKAEFELLKNINSEVEKFLKSRGEEPGEPLIDISM